MKTRNFSYGFLFFRASTFFLLFGVVISFVFYSSKINPHTSISTNTFNLTNDNKLIKISDESKVWNAENEVEIFKVSYSNSHGSFVESGNQDKVIAPGTEGSYTFNLKNTSDGIVEYDLKLNAEFFINEQEVKFENVPLKARIKSSNQEYYLGSNSSWATLDELNEFLDSNQLSKNNYAYYTFDWKWEFEENDSFDTGLGLLANTQEIDFKITIVTQTNLISDLSEEKDVSKIIFPIAAGLSSSFIVILFIVKNRKKIKTKV